MKKIVFFVPIEDAEKVKDAVFAAGAGKIGDYDRCCFQIEGMGQFRPLDGAQPHLGKHNELETVRELRVELVSDDQFVKPSIDALLKAHPYEEVAFEVFDMLDWTKL
ncbi:NGG1p interacting factor NIF3 [Vibrio maerlii]|uniref:NGG1p interacting factor NIF3 n=1 Tax=Vibrio maerlii TaxID=2231648 RepID=UPI000E3C737B|nr:NGG1p interacting factor NIF3 [Vibrio maerlii]